MEKGFLHTNECLRKAASNGGFSFVLSMSKGRLELVERSGIIDIVLRRG